MSLPTTPVISVAATIPDSLALNAELISDLFHKRSCGIITSVTLSKKHRVALNVPDTAKQIVLAWSADGKDYASGEVPLKHGLFTKLFFDRLVTDSPLPAPQV